MTDEKKHTLKDLLDAWDNDANSARVTEVGDAMVPLLEMLGVDADIPQSQFNVSVFESEEAACLVRMFWGEFVVLRLPDKAPMVNMWAMLLSIDCEEHGAEWVPFPMASTLPHMLRTGLTNIINAYMARQLGEITVPHGTTIN